MSSGGPGGDWTVSTGFAERGHGVPDLASQRFGQLVMCDKKSET